MINKKALESYEWAKSVDMEVYFCFGGRWYHLDGSDKDGFNWVVYETTEPGEKNDSSQLADLNFYYYKNFDDIERNCKIQGKPFLYAIQHCTAMYC